MRLSLCCLGLLLALSPAPSTAQQSDLPTPEALTRAYLLQNGGKEYLDSIRSLRLTGVIDENDLRYEITLIKKRPDHVRLILRSDRSEIHYGFNGTLSWRQFQVGTQSLKPEILDSTRSNPILSQRNFDGPLVDYIEQGITLEVLRREVYARQSCYVVEMTHPNGRLTTIYLDTQRLRELRRLETDPETGDQTELKLENYRLKDKLWIPWTLKRYRNGQLVSHFEVQQVDLNVGVFSNYFDPPPHNVDITPKPPKAPATDSPPAPPAP